MKIKQTFPEIYTTKFITINRETIKSIQTGRVNEENLDFVQFLFIRRFVYALSQFRQFILNIKN